MAFHYEYSSEKCELVEAVEGHGVKRHKVDYFLTVC